MEKELTKEQRENTKCQVVRCPRCNKTVMVSVMVGGVLSKDQLKSTAKCMKAGGVISYCTVKEARKTKEWCFLDCNK